MKFKSEEKLRNYLNTQIERYPRDGIIKAVFISQINHKRYYIIDEGDDLVFPDTYGYVYDDPYAHYKWAGPGYKCNSEHIKTFIGMDIEEDNIYIGKSLYYMYNSFEIMHYQEEIELCKKKIKRLEDLNRAYEL